MSDPYGQPSGQPDPYGQQPYGQQPYGQYGQPVADRRPGTVTAAAWITIVFSAIVAAIFGFTALALLVARDQVITEMERVPEFQDANIDADAAVGVLVAVMLGLVVWAVIALAVRAGGFKLFGGGYEHDAISALGRVMDNVRVNLPRMLAKEFAYGFFGQKFFVGGTEVISVLAIASSLLLLRHNPLWTLIILLTVAVTVGAA